MLNGNTLAPRGGDGQYPVLLLNEEQVVRLLQRQSPRQVTRALPIEGSYSTYARLMRRGRIVMLLAGLLIGGVAAWAWAPRPMLPALPWARAAAAPTIATGASFSVIVASARDVDRAAEAAGRLVAVGVPAYTRTRAEGTAARQVLAGPYVSLDEAEGMQRRLARLGFGAGRLFVDDSLREAPRNLVVAKPAENPTLVLVGAPARLSLSLELRHEPRQVSAARVTSTSLEVVVGPVEGDVTGQEWSAPAGVHLLHHVAVDEIAGSGRGRYVRATLTVPQFARANTRVHGRRVYVDLTWTEGNVPRAAVRRTAAPRQPAPAAAPAEPDPRPVVQPSIEPSLARFAQVLPFVQSAAREPAPEVLRALVPTVEELERTLREGPVGGAWGDAPALLMSAVAAAARAVDPAFPGDRIAEAQQAAGWFEAARALSTPARGAAR